MKLDIRRLAGRRPVRIAAALGLLATTLVAVDSSPAQGAIPDGFAAQPPERLYMMPRNPLAPIPPEIVALAVPVQTLPFVGMDLISMDDRPIVVDFVDTPATPNPPGPCNIVDVGGPVGFPSDYAIGSCTRIQLSVNYGKLAVGALTKVYQDNPDGTNHDGSNPAYAVYLTASGARVDISDSVGFNAGQDYIDNAGVSMLNLNGTKAQLNQALQLLTYTPDPDLDDDGDPTEQDFYKYEGSNPETLSITLVPNDGSGPFEWKVDIRVLDVNDWPDLKGEWELGDGAGDGPPDQNANPGIEFVIPGGSAGHYDVTDPDNDDAIDGNSNDPDDDDYDADGKDGAGDDMLLIGYLDCGQPIAPNTGFHFSSASFVGAIDSIDSALNYLLGLGNPPVPPVSPPEAVAGYNQKLLVKSAFITALGVTPLADVTLTNTGTGVDYTQFFVGVTEIDEVQDALEDIYFQHNAEGDTCTMLVIVSDLGNNGLPLQYVSDPDAREYGVEFPFFGFDWDEFTITTGELIEIDASFAPAPDPLVAAGPLPETVTGVINITPAQHPGFTLRFSTVNGTAQAGSDFAGLTNLTVPVDPDQTSVEVSTNVFPNSAGEFDETFTYSITVGTPVPAGYKITTNVPTRTVLIPGPLSEDPDATTTTSSTTTTTTTTEPDDSTTTTSEPDDSTTTTSEPDDSTTTTSEPDDSTTTTSEPDDSTTTTSEPDDSTTTTSEPDDSTTTTSEPDDSTTTTDSTTSTTTTTLAPNPLTLTIDVPDDIVVQVPNGQTGANVNYPAPTTAGGTPPVSVACDKASGAFYPLGTTTVTCTATDSAQVETLQQARLDVGTPPTVRSALTATDSFTITVVELPATTVPVTPPTTTDLGAIPPVPTPPPGGELPATGSNILDVLAVAAIMIATGSVVLAARRRGSAA